MKYRLRVEQLLSRTVIVEVDCEPEQLQDEASRVVDDQDWSEVPLDWCGTEVTNDESGETVLDT